MFFFPVAMLCLGIAFLYRGSRRVRHSAIAATLVAGVLGVVILLAGSGEDPAPNAAPTPTWQPIQGCLQREAAARTLLGETRTYVADTPIAGVVIADDRVGFRDRIAVIAGGDLVTVSPDAVNADCGQRTAWRRLVVGGTGFTREMLVTFGSASSRDAWLTYNADGSFAWAQVRTVPGGPWAIVPPQQIQADLTPVSAPDPVRTGFLPAAACFTTATPMRTLTGVAAGTAGAKTFATRLLSPAPDARKAGLVPVARDGELVLVPADRLKRCTTTEQAVYVMTPEGGVEGHAPHGTVDVPPGEYVGILARDLRGRRLWAVVNLPGGFAVIDARPLPDRAFHAR